MRPSGVHGALLPALTPSSPRLLPSHLHLPASMWTPCCARSCVCPAAAFRSFGELAELPLLAVRPELQRRNGLGRLLLAAVEYLLLQAGTEVGGH